LKLEDDHVATLGFVPMEPPVRRKGDVQAVADLVHEEAVADLEGGDHRATRDREGLEDEAPDQQGEHDRPADGLYVLSQPSLSVGAQVTLQRLFEVLGGATEGALRSPSVATRGQEGLGGLQGGLELFALV
jgi:hypothetical protein